MLNYSVIVSLFGFGKLMKTENMCMNEIFIWMDKSMRGIYYLKIFFMQILSTATIHVIQTESAISDGIH